MKAIFKNERALTRKSQAIWLGMMVMLIGFCYFEFLSLKDSLGELAVMINRFPRVMMIVFGVRESIDTAIGWYSCLYFWVGLLAFAYAMEQGLSCVSKEVRAGTAEYLFTKPVPRGEIVLGKAVASVCALAVFSACTGLCNYLLLILPMGGLEQKWAPLTTTIGMFLTQVVLFSIGFLLSAVAKHPVMATGLGIAITLAAYVLMFAAQYTQFVPLAVLSPLCWFDVLDVMEHGIRIPYLLLAGVTCAICVVVAHQSWQRRELR